MSKQKQQGDLLLDYFALREAIACTRPLGLNSPRNERIDRLLESTEVPFLITGNSNFNDQKRAYDILFTEWHRTLAKWQHEQLLLSYATLNSWVAFLEGKLPDDLSVRVQSLLEEIERRLHQVVSFDERATYQYKVTRIFGDVWRILGLFPTAPDPTSQFVVFPGFWQENITARSISIKLKDLRCLIWPAKLISRNGNLARELRGCEDSLRKLQTFDHTAFTTHQYMLMVSAVNEQVESLAHLMAKAIPTHLNNVTIPGQWKVITGLVDVVAEHPSWNDDQRFSNAYKGMLELQSSLKHIPVDDWQKLVRTANSLHDQIKVVQTTIRGFQNQNPPTDHMLNGATKASEDKGFFSFNGFNGLTSQDLQDHGFDPAIFLAGRGFVPDPQSVQATLL